MKKLLTALALVLALTGCTTSNNKPEEPKGPAAITTLDVATFAGEMEKTEIAKIKVDVIDAEGHEIEWALKDAQAELRTNLVNTLKTLNLTEAEDQAKQYGNYSLFIDLNSVLDTNYARLIVVGDILTVKTSAGHKNYTIDDAAKTVLTTFINEVATEYAKVNAQ